MKHTFLLLLLNIPVLMACHAERAVDDSEQSGKANRTAAKKDSSEADNLPVVEGEAREVGRLGFVVLPGWETGPKKIGEGLVIYAPMQDEWKAIGFRPNCFISIRKNPGVNLDTLEQGLHTVLSQNVAALDAQLQENIKSADVMKDNSLSMTDVTYELKRSELKDGYPCLKSEADGAFELNGNLVRTKTYSVAIVGNDHLYTAGLTMPLGHKKEMDEAWTAFFSSLKFRRR